MNNNQENDRLYHVLTEFREKIYPIFPYHLMKTILSLTQGQIFLVRKLCELIEAEKSNLPEGAQEQAAWVEHLAQSQLIDHWENNKASAHLQEIADILLAFEGGQQKLSLYQKILEGNAKSDNDIQEQQLLELGLISINDDGETLKVTNSIYEKVFNPEWVEQKLTLNQSAIINNIMVHNEQKGMNPRVARFISIFVALFSLLGILYFIFRPISQPSDPDAKNKCIQINTLLSLGNLSSEYDNLSDLDRLIIKRDKSIKQIRDIVSQNSVRELCKNHLTPEYTNDVAQGYNNLLYAQAIALAQRGYQPPRFPLANEGVYTLRYNNATELLCLISQEDLSAEVKDKLQEWRNNKRQETLEWLKNNSCPAANS